MPVGHHAHHTSEFQNLKTALLAFQYYSRLLSLSACFFYRERKESFPETSQLESQDSLQLPRRNNKEKMNSEGSTNSSYSGVSFSREGDIVVLRIMETLAGDRDSDSDYK